MQGDPTPENSSSSPEQTPKKKLLGAKTPDHRGIVEREYQRLKAERDAQKKEEERPIIEAQSKAKLDNITREILSPFEDALIDSLDEHPEGLKVSHGRFRRNNWTHKWHVQTGEGKSTINYGFILEYKYGESGKKLNRFQMSIYRHNYHEDSSKNISAKMIAEFEEGQMSSVLLTGEDRQTPFRNPDLVREFNSFENLPSSSDFIRAIKALPYVDKSDEIYFDFKNRTLKVHRPIPMGKDVTHEYVFDPYENEFSGNDGIKHKITDDFYEEGIVKIDNSAYLGLLKAVLNVVPGE